MGRWSLHIAVSFGLVLAALLSFSDLIVLERQHSSFASTSSSDVLRPPPLPPPTPPPPPPPPQTPPPKVHLEPIEPAAVDASQPYMLESARLSAARSARVSANDATFLTAGLTDLQLLSGLKGQHVVMVGDSLQRYQYLSLIYALEYGSYPKDEDKPNICREGDYRNLPSEVMSSHDLKENERGWPAFMVVTSHKFAGKERCDCYRSPTDAKYTVENRFYRKVWPSGEVTSVSYFTKLNTPTIHGHTFQDGPPSILNITMHGKIGRKSLDWDLRVDEFLAKLMRRELPIGGDSPLPQPTIVLWNEGIWNDNYKGTIDSITAGAAAFRDSGVRLQWKTTTRNFFTEYQNFQSFAKEAKAASDYAVERGLEVVDAFSWGSIFVKKIEDPATLKDHTMADWKNIYPQFEEFFWDPYHFSPFVYTIINRRWLYQILGNELT